MKSVIFAATIFFLLAEAHAQDAAPSGTLKVQDFAPAVVNELGPCDVVQVFDVILPRKVAISSAMHLISLHSGTGQVSKQVKLKDASTGNDLAVVGTQINSTAPLPTIHLSPSFGPRLYIIDADGGLVSSRPEKATINYYACTKGAYVGVIGYWPGFAPQVTAVMQVYTGNKPAGMDNFGEWLILR